MGARIVPFFENVTETFSYLVIDPPTQAAAIIDPVLDYDPAAGRIRRTPPMPSPKWFKPRVCRSNGFWRRTSMPTIFRRRAI